MSNVHPLFSPLLGAFAGLSPKKLRDDLANAGIPTTVLAPDGSEQEARLPDPEPTKAETLRERVTRLRAEYEMAQEDVLRAMRRAEGLWTLLLKAEDEERDERNQH